MTMRLDDWREDQIEPTLARVRRDVEWTGGGVQYPIGSRMWQAAEALLVRGELTFVAPRSPEERRGVPVGFYNRITLNEALASGTVPKCRPQSEAAAEVIYDTAPALSEAPPPTRDNPIPSHVPERKADTAAPASDTIPVEPDWCGWVPMTVPSMEDIARAIAAARSALRGEAPMTRADLVVLVGCARFAATVRTYLDAT